MRKILSKVLALAAVFVLPMIARAQGTPTEKGIDQRIDEWFRPIADAVVGVVFFEVPFGNNIRIPFIVILLVIGALFFTLYFSFINIRKFGLAIRVVRGKYDYLDKSAAHVKAPELNVTREGDILDTIKDESHHGEVNHFQALATAVSGTVGLGNIAGVAVAVAVGGPGATFWMIVCGLLGMSTKFVECTLGVKYRDMDSKGTVFGGPMYYLSRGLKETKGAFLGKPLAILFAILC
ncbi:MAG: sodium:alanine symporter family protein, partial [Flavisolibacter sp.]|nr:sodium:alanine symporter family protein [Flavisolibacter sp.]